MSKHLRTLLAYTLTIAAVLGCVTYTQAGWNDFIWPLCGRLGEDPDSLNWTQGAHCPDTVINDPGAYPDVPIHHGYGFRNMTDTTADVSFHRGLDLATFAATSSNGLPGNPVFAVAEGRVKDINNNGICTDTDCSMTILHPKNPTLDHDTWCKSGNKCIATVYNHIQNVQVEEDDYVSRGQFIAYTGESASTQFKHLHFEVRWPQTRLSTDTGKWTYAKDAVNPMRFLPYTPTTGTINLSVTEGGFTAYNKPVLATVTVSADTGYMMDFEGVSFIAYQLDSTVTPAKWVIYGKDTGLLNGFNYLSSLTSLSQSGTYLDDDYLVVDGSYDYCVHNPETLNRHYSPFPESSSKWNNEKGITYYKELWEVQNVTVQHGLDGLVELNAAGDFTTQDGNRYHAFDFKVITASPNLTGNDHLYWDLTVGFLGYDIPTSTTPMCYVAVATMLKQNIPDLPPIPGDRKVIATAHSDPNHPCASYNFDAVSEIFSGPGKVLGVDQTRGLVSVSMKVK